MESKKQSFKDALKYGQEGEHEIAEALINKGVNLMPLYQFETEHAPFILAGIEKLVSPDLLCFSLKAVFMAEVKTKNRWIEFKGVRETGLDLRLFNQYKKVQVACNIPVWLFFNHKTQEPKGIYYCLLGKHTRLWNGLKKTGEYVQKPMVFYDYKKLFKLGNNNLADK